VSVRCEVVVFILTHHVGRTLYIKNDDDNNNGEATIIPAFYIFSYLQEPLVVSDSSILFSPNVNLLLATLYSKYITIARCMNM